MKAKTDGKWERKSDSEGGKQGVRSNLRNEERVEKKYQEWSDKNWDIKRVTDGRIINEACCYLTHPKETGNRGEGRTTPHPCLSCQSAFPLCWEASSIGMERERKREQSRKREVRAGKKGWRANKVTRWERWYGGIEGKPVWSPEVIFYHDSCGRGNKTEFVWPCVTSTHSSHYRHLQPQVRECMCVRLRGKIWENVLKGTWSNSVASPENSSSHFYVTKSLSLKALRHFGSQLSPGVELHTQPSNVSSYKSLVTHMHATQPHPSTNRYCEIHPDI